MFVLAGYMIGTSFLTREFHPSLPLQLASHVTALEAYPRVELLSMPCSLPPGHRKGCERHLPHRRGVSAFPPCSLSPCLSAKGAGGCPKGLCFSHPSRGNLTSTETAHTDTLSS